MSTTGQYQIVSIAENSNPLYLSNDYGITWNPTATAKDWTYLAISGTGQYILAYDDDDSVLWISIDYGVTWNINVVNTNIDYMRSIALSALADYFIVVGNGTLYIIEPYAVNVIGNANITSTITANTVQTTLLKGTSGTFNTLTVLGTNNVEITPTAVTSIPSGDVKSIAMSATGQYQSAIQFEDAGGDYRNILISSDYGQTWIVSPGTPSLPSGTYFVALAMSGTGQYQSALAYNNFIYISSNFGNSWTVTSQSIGQRVRPATVWMAWAGRPRVRGGQRVMR
jgi:hypothetical protein